MENIEPTDTLPEKERKIKFFLDKCKSLDISDIDRLSYFIFENNEELKKISLFNKCVEVLIENSEKYLSKFVVTMDTMNRYHTVCDYLDTYVLNLLPKDGIAHFIRKEIFYSSEFKSCFMISEYLRSEIKDPEVLKFLNSDIDVRYGYIPPIQLIKKIMELKSKLQFCRFPTNVILSTDDLKNEPYKEAFIDFIVNNEKCHDLLLNLYPDAKTSRNPKLFLIHKFKNDKVTYSIYSKYRDFMIKYEIVADCLTTSVADALDSVLYLCEKVSHILFDFSDDFKDEQDCLKKLKSKFIKIIRKINKHIDDEKISVNKIMITDDEIRKEEDITKLYATYSKVVFDKKKELTEDYKKTHPVTGGSNYKY
jgi:hypothetical protein